MGQQVGINFLLCTCTLQWAILCQGFWDHVRLQTTGVAKGFHPIELSLEAVIIGDYNVWFRSESCDMCVPSKSGSYQAD